MWISIRHQRESTAFDILYLKIVAAIIFEYELALLIALQGDLFGREGGGVDS